MPYHVSLSPTLGSQQLYRVTVLEDFDRSTARALEEWIDAARQNPEARFSLDLSRAGHVDASALRRLRTRHGELVADGRLEVIGASERAAILEAPVVTSVVLPLLELAVNSA